MRKPATGVVMAAVIRPKTDAPTGSERGGLTGRIRFLAAWSVAILLAGYAYPVATVAGQDASPEEGECRFSDVPDSSVAHADVVFACQQSWFSGYPDGSFQPDRPVPPHQIATVVGRAFAAGSTRADIATFLRGDNPGDPTASAGFTDVPDTHPQAEDIDYAVERSWFRGYPDGSFRPDQAITAAQITTVLQRAFPTGSTRAQLAAFMRNGRQALPWTSKIAYSAPVYNSLGKLAARELLVAGVGGSDTRKISDDVGQWEWSPDGRQITYSAVVRNSRGSNTGNYEWWVANADGTEPRKITNKGENRKWPPNGRRITYRQGDDELWVVSADGTEPLLLTDNSRRGNWEWSPDGNRIAYETNGRETCCPRRNRVELWVAGDDGTDPRLLTNDVWHWEQWWRRGNWEWSPDGMWITYETDSHELWVASADGMNSHMLTDNLSDGNWVSIGGNWEWSPNSEWIVYRRGVRIEEDYYAYRRGGYELWVASADSTNTRLLTDYRCCEKDWRDREWSPDGEWIAYRRGDDLWVEGADGTNPRKVTNNGRDFWRWSPNSEWIEHRRGDDEWWLESADGTDARRVNWAGGRRWSPDGEWIAVKRGNGELWLEKADGTDAHNLTNNWSGYWKWSPNSEWIAYRVGVWEFGSLVSGEWWVAGTDGTNPRNLGSDSTDGGWMGLERWEWSQDGERFAYEMDNGDLWVAGIDDTKVRKLTDDVGPWAWQPMES